MKHKLYILLFALSIVLTVEAQHDGKAKQVLDNVASTYAQCNGMKIEFKGTQKGTLWLNGDRFVLDCGGVKSWFDGETQWSYVAGNEEVSVSSPTPEEIQVVNPYSLITMYQNGFNYRYEGLKLRDNKRGEEITLIPQKRKDIRMISVCVDEKNIPFYIGVDMNNGHYEEFILSRFDKTPLPDDFFRFNIKEYPNVEVIDLR